MKRRIKDLPITMDDLRDMMKKEKAKRCGVIVVAVSVVTILAGLVIWIAKKREKDLEEHYEYFDDDFDELDDNYEGFDESIYDDEDQDDEEIEYVKIKDFINDNEEAAAKEEAKPEKTDKKAE